MYADYNLYSCANTSNISAYHPETDLLDGSYRNVFFGTTNYDYHYAVVKKKKARKFLSLKYYSKIKLKKFSKSCT